MESQITDIQWFEFIKVVTTVIETNPDPIFIETVAETLSVEILSRYVHWITTGEGRISNCRKKVRFVLDSWKSLQTRFGLGFLLDELDYKLSSGKNFNELRSKLRAHFGADAKEYYVPKEENGGSIRINKIKYYPDQILGKGQVDTAVYKGKFGERMVAVKRVHAELWSFADTEAAHLIRLDGHENIIRYYWKEQCSRFIYLALELCDFDLKQYVEASKKYPKINGIDIFVQAVKGVRHLHGLKPPILHRDLQPVNILIRILDASREPRVVVADLGLSKALIPNQDINQDTVLVIPYTAGGGGWMAPEILRAIRSESDKRERATLKSDIFSLGCILHYILTSGKHPFGENHIKRDYNILEGVHSKMQLDKDKPYHDLVKSMIHSEPSARPTAANILSQLQPLGVINENESIKTESTSLKLQKEELKTMNGTVEALQLELNDTKEDLAKKTQKISSLTNDIDMYKQEKESDMHKMATEKAQYEEKINASETILIGKQKEILDLQSQLTKERETTAGLAKKDGDSSARIKTLTSKISDVEAANLCLKQKHADMAKKIEDQHSTYMSQIAAKDDEVKRLQNEIEDLRSNHLSQLAKKENETIGLQHDIESIRSNHKTQLAIKEDEKTKLHEDMEDQQCKHVSQLGAKNDEIKRLVDELANQVSADQYRILEENHSRAVLQLETRCENLQREHETRHREMVQSHTILSDELASKNVKIQQLEERINRSLDEYKESDAKCQELETNKQRVLKELIRKETENTMLREEYEREYSTMASLSVIRKMTSRGNSLIENTTKQMQNLEGQIKDGRQIVEKLLEEKNELHKKLLNSEGNINLLKDHLEAARKKLEKAEEILRPHKPMILRKQLKAIAEIKLGETYSKTFEFSGNPPPRINWITDKEEKLENNEKFTIVKREYSTTLTIRKSVRKDARYYRLCIENEFGDDSEQVYLNVLSKPSKPVGPLDVKSILANRVRLSWKSPKDDGGRAIKHYGIELFYPKTRSWKRIGNKEVENLDELSFVVNDLKESKEHLFRVIAFNDEGGSEPLEADYEIGPKIHGSTPSITSFNNPGSIMSDACDIEWKKALDTTNEVVLEELGRGKAFLETLSKSLGIAGEFVAWLSIGNNNRLTTYEKMEEIINLWSQHQNKGTKNRKDLVKYLKEHHKANSCVALIARLSSLSDDNTESSSSDAKLSRTIIDSQENVIVQTPTEAQDSSNHVIGQIKGNGNQACFAIETAESSINDAGNKEEIDPNVTHQRPDLLNQVSDNEIKEGRLHGDQNHDSRDKSEANDKPASELISDPNLFNENTKVNDQEWDESGNNIGQRANSNTSFKIPKFERSESKFSLSSKLTQSIVMKYEKELKHLTIDELSEIFIKHLMSIDHSISDNDEVQSEHALDQNKLKAISMLVKESLSLFSVIQSRLSGKSTEDRNNCSSKT